MRAALVVRAVVVVAAVGLMFALLYAAFPSPHPGLAGGLSGGTAVLLAGYVRNRAYRRLSRTERDRVDTVQRTAVPTGDYSIDRLALNRLERVAKNARGDRVALPVLAVAFMALAVLAATRSGAGWLAAGIALAALFGQGTWRARHNDPRHRLAALRQAMNAD